MNTAVLDSTHMLPNGNVHGYQPTTRPNEGLVDGDPLQDDSRLLRGLRITETVENDPTAVRKVPSDQTLPKLRWGSTRRTSGRSKSGLQISVPSREVPVQSVVSGSVTGKSIMYTYESSSSSSGKTSQSLGAIGDHLPSARSVLLSSGTMLDIPEGTLPKPSLRTARSSNTLSPLSNLVLESWPDEDSYKLLVMGEFGPVRDEVVPHIVDPSKLVPQRRRSLSDLIESPTILSTKIDLPRVIPPTNGNNAKVEWLRPIAAQSRTCEALAHAPENSGVSIQETAPVWYRAGPPFDVIAKEGSRERIARNPQYCDLDPTEFSLPYGVRRSCRYCKSIH